LDYLTVKAIHVWAVVATFGLFVLRGVWMIRDSPLLQWRPVRIVPHAIDTVLLVAGVWMVVMIRQYPFVAGWLTAKVTGLVVYIVLGMIALRRGRSKRVRIAAWLAAQVVFLYIVAVALTRNPWPLA
jgi:uncharacterized membrane protein SirB2